MKKFTISLIVAVCFIVTCTTALAMPPQFTPPRKLLVLEHLGPNNEIPWQQLCIIDHGLGYFTVSDMTGDGFEDNLHLTILFRDVHTNRILDVQIWHDDYYDWDSIRACYDSCAYPWATECLNCLPPRPYTRRVYHDMPYPTPKHVRVELRTIERECGDGPPCYWEPDVDGHLFAWAQW